MTYPIPTELARADIIIKKSQFIAYAKHIESRADGLNWLAEIKAEYPGARHHCWAYQIGHPERASNAGMGDDGEPSGTAGKPILNVLQHKGVGDVMVIVVRYFGGIKLGAGGLTRAYSGAAQAVMEVLPVAQQVAQTDIHIQASFALEQPLRHWVGMAEGLVVQVNYGEQIEMQVQVPSVNLDSFQGTLNGFSGQGCAYKVIEPVSD